MRLANTQQDPQIYKKTSRLNSNADTGYLYLIS